MIIVRVELLSAITGRTTELARMTIVNDGTSENPRSGNYEAVTLRGRNREALEKSMLSYHRDHILGAAPHRGEIKGHRRLDLHVWFLVAKALEVTGYGRRKGE